MKIQIRHILIVLMAAILPVVTMVYQVRAAGPKVSEIGNKHNLSGLNTAPGVTYRAKTLMEDPTNIRGQQICIFCHTPHNANVEGQAPLWNRKFSSETFQRYSTDTLQIRKFEKIPDANYGVGAQPTGSSKLCLSCHDGASSLGTVKSGPPIAMKNDVDIISGLASFNPTNTNKMKTGHHPVSFVYNAAVLDAIKAGRGTALFQLPDPAKAKLDKQSRMQCTTCHDAHQNMSNDTDFYSSPGNETRKIAPFWVYGVNNSGSADQEAVCTTCHPMNLITLPWPTP